MKHNRYINIITLSYIVLHIYLSINTKYTDRYISYLIDRYISTLFIDISIYTILIYLYISYTDEKYINIVVLYIESIKKW